jgi:DDE superfamily endonuclease
MWIPKGKHPIVTVTGSHEKTCVFGMLTIDGKQLFRQYKTFDQHSFISYLQELKRKFHKLLILLFLDRAPPQHCRSQRVKAYIERNSDDTMIDCRVPS